MSHFSQLVLVVLEHALQRPLFSSLRGQWQKPSYLTSLHGAFESFRVGLGVGASPAADGRPRFRAAFTHTKASATFAWNFLRFSTSFAGNPTKRQSRLYKFHALTSATITKCQRSRYTTGGSSCRSGIERGKNQADQFLPYFYCTHL